MKRGYHRVNSIKRVIALRKLIIFIPLLCIVASIGCGGGGGGGVAGLLPGQGVSFSQVDFTWLGATTLNSNTGQVDVDIATLQSSTGILSGFINISTSLGWVVQNLPVFSDFPYPSISTTFQLSTSSGIDITSLDAFVDFTLTPATSFEGGHLTTFPVGDIRFNGEGKGAPVTGGPPAPQPPGVVAFIPGGLLQVCLQPGHPNVEAANSQCGPAAAANSLQWLEDTYGIVVPHPHIPGLGCIGAGGPDGSLVGELDSEMGRDGTCVNRVTRGGVNDGPFLAGKLCYLALNGLGGTIIVKHQDDGTLAGDPGGANFMSCGLTSLGRGAVPTAEFIIDEVCKGEDVELGYSRPGGHWVQIVGAGTTLGHPWILHRSDQVQSGDDAVPPPDAIDNNEGTGGTQFASLRDIDGDGFLNLLGEPGSPEADIVVSESPAEVDFFPNSKAEVTINTPFGPDTVELTGPTTVIVDIGNVADTDGDGREQVQTEIVQMELTGTSTLLGPVTVRLRDPNKHPFQRSTGEIEETINNTPGVLDIPPFTATGTAESFFDVFFEVEVPDAPPGLMLLHNDIPKHMETTITHKPPAEGETYESPEEIPLIDEAENDTGVRIGETFHIPNPSEREVIQ